MKVSAVIVTRGNVDLRPVLDSLPPEWEQVVWNNGGTKHGDGALVTVRARATDSDAQATEVGPPRSVYGRYAAIEHASGDLIYVQDDDCVVDAPRALYGTWLESEALNQAEHDPEPLRFAVCNMPPEFRHDFYTDHHLVGFGAMFHRSAPGRAFREFAEAGFTVDQGVFDRTADVVFTGLTPVIRENIPRRNLEWATADNRMYRRREHTAERHAMLRLVQQVKQRRAA